MTRADAYDAGAAFDAWRRALIHLTRTEAAAREWRYARSAFRHRPETCHRSRRAA